MRQIEQMTRQIVEKIKLHESDTVPGDFGELKAPCPKCGGVIKENYKKFQCQKCDFALWKIVAGRQLGDPGSGGVDHASAASGRCKGSAAKLGGPLPR